MNTRKVLTAILILNGFMLSIRGACAQERYDRIAPTYDIWLGGDEICAKHADHLIEEARAAFEKQYEPRLTQFMQKVYDAQGLNKITAATFEGNGPAGIGEKVRIYRISAPGTQRDDSSTVRIWHAADIDDSSVWRKHMNGLVLQRLDMLGRDTVPPRVACSLYDGDAELTLIAPSGVKVYLPDMPSFFHTVTMDLDGGNEESSHEGLAEIYNRFYGK
ncbi:MAG: hypothetical protein WCU88_06430 [Elusimicrobiota bacterium]